MTEIAVSGWLEPCRGECVGARAGAILKGLRRLSLGHGGFHGAVDRVAMPGNAKKYRTVHEFGRKKRKRRGKKPKQSPEPSIGVQEEGTDVPRPSAPLTTPTTQIVEADSGSIRIDTKVLTDAEIKENRAREKATLDQLSSEPATARKIEAFTASCSEASALDSEHHAAPYVVLRLDVMNSLLGALRCNVCRGSVTIVRGGNDYGLAVKLAVQCNTCGEIASEWTSPRVDGAKTCNPFEVNLLAARAMVATGNGQTKMNDIFAMMGISHRGMHHKTYQRHLKSTLAPAATRAAESALKVCGKKVAALYEELCFGNKGNIAVSYDGTWMTRGHSSHIGVGAVIELFSGYVLDYVVLSNFCLGCEVGPKPDSTEYEEWRKGHQCQKNSDSKAGQMEVEAALILFQRSLERHGLRYTTMLCDGDSRTFSAIQEAKVYGFIEVKKEDCINHVQKRMGTALRNLVQKHRSEGKRGLGGRGRLTGELITRLSTYYGRALKSYEGDVEQMQKAVMATYRHITSTDECADHSLCPAGEGSWCRHNAAKAKGEPDPKHNYNLPKDVAEALLPVYTRLSEKALLERCQRGKTQNTNESLHSVIWSLASKDKHASLVAVESAVAEAVLRFNTGNLNSATAILSEMNVGATISGSKRAKEKDHRRSISSSKKRAASLELGRLVKKKHESRMHADYAPGAF